MESILANKLLVKHVSYNPNNAGYSYHIANISNRMMFITETNTNCAAETETLNVV
jgi:hypothetical protein